MKSNHVYTFKPAAANQPAEITIYGPIGKDFFGEGISAADFHKELRALGTPRAIDLRISSEGGAVFDARAIYTMLTQHRADITVYVDGYAASAASLIAMAGDKIVMAEGGFIMIHEARAYVGGTANQMRELADVLEQINETMVSTYSARTGQPADKIKEWMTAETWFNGTDALDAGFVDEIMHDLKAVAYLPGLDRYQNVPAALRQNTPNRLRALKLLREIRK